jgi:hypothetical protein
MLCNGKTSSRFGRKIKPHVKDSAEIQEAAYEDFRARLIQYSTGIRRCGAEKSPRSPGAKFAYRWFSTSPTVRQQRMQSPRFRSCHFNWSISTTAKPFQLARLRLGTLLPISCKTSSASFLDNMRSFGLIRSD